LSWTSSKSASGRPELASFLDVVDDRVEQPLGRADRAGAEAETPVVEDVHRDPEALAGLAEHVLRRDAHVAEVEVAQVVAAQAHRVVAPADLEAVHAALDDQRDVAAPAADLGAGEGDQH